MSEQDDNGTPGPQIKPPEPPEGPIGFRVGIAEPSIVVFCLSVKDIPRGSFAGEIRTLLDPKIAMKLAGMLQQAAQRAVASKPILVVPPGAMPKR